MKKEEVGSRQSAGGSEEKAGGSKKGAGKRRVGLLGRVAILFVRGYQRFISPILPRCCRFQPTCSAYAIEAIQKKGLIRGSLKAAWRILRCNPFCKGGYDPVDPPVKQDDGASG